MLRALLGRYLESDPRTLRIAPGAHGKPALLEDTLASTAAAQARQAATMSSRLDFNLSHSGQLALYAFTETGAVGIDVEVARRPLNEVAIAERTLGAAEATRLSALDPRTREREFLRLWTRHEAELKYWGTGIGDQATGVRGRQPWIAELNVGSRAAAAIALTLPPRELCCWQWRP